MKKKFVFIISIPILIIIFTIAYYFLVLLPEKKDAEYLFSMKKQCVEKGQQYYRQKKVETTQNVLFKSAGGFSNEEYGFNKELNTCLLYFHYGFAKYDFNELNNMVNGYDESVVDIFANKTLLHINTHGYDSGDVIYLEANGQKIMSCGYPEDIDSNCETRDKIIEEFWKREKELFNQ